MMQLLLLLSQNLVLLRAKGHQASHNLSQQQHQLLQGCLQQVPGVMKGMLLTFLMTWARHQLRGLWQQLLMLLVQECCLSCNMGPLQQDQHNQHHQ
jgi:hypothetical protein